MEVWKDYPKYKDPFLEELLNLFRLEWWPEQAFNFREYRDEITGWANKVKTSLIKAGIDRVEIIHLNENSNEKAKNIFRSFLKAQKDFLEYLTTDTSEEEISVLASAYHHQNKNKAETLILNIYKNNKKLYSISGPEFESVIRQLLILWDFHIIPTRQTRDGGIDMLAFKNKPYPTCAAIECKTSRKHSIGVEVIRGVMYVAEKIKASCAFIFTNSKFSKDACKEQTLQKYKLQLFDGKKVLNLIRDYVSNFFPTVAFA